MSRSSLILSVVILGFTAITVLALREAGYWGIIASHFQSWAGAQVLTDLVILCVLSCIWMVLDGGKRAWPFVLLTLVAGSFGPLFYLLTRPNQGSYGAK